MRCRNILAAVSLAVAVLSSPQAFANNEQMTVRDKQELIARAQSSSEVNGLIMVLAEHGWTVTDWKQAHVEIVPCRPGSEPEGIHGPLKRVVVPVQHVDATGQVTARADLLYAISDAGEAQVALRPSDSNAATLLADSESAASTDPVDAAQSESSSQTPGEAPDVPSCAAVPGGNCGSWSCRYIETRGTNFVCLDWDFNPFAQYYYLRWRTGPIQYPWQYALYASYKGCGVACPWPNSTGSVFVCGQIPNPRSCTGF